MDDNVLLKLTCNWHQEYERGYYAYTTTGQKQQLNFSSALQIIFELLGNLGLSNDHLAQMFH